jgi:hypothetical protein
MAEFMDKDRRAEQADHGGNYVNDIESQAHE